MNEMYNSFKNSAIAYTVMTLDLGSFVEHVKSHLKNKYPEITFDEIDVVPPEDFNENDEPELKLAFETDLEERPEESYASTDLAEFVSKIIDAEVSFCTIRGEYIDLWFAE